MRQNRVMGPWDRSTCIGEHKSADQIEGDWAHAPMRPDKVRQWGGAGQGRAND